MNDSHGINCKKNKIILANIAFHDQIADDYAKSSSVFDKNNQIRIKKNFEYLYSDCHREKRINLLDIGCGTGNILKIAESFFENIYGVDISKRVLLKSKEYCPVARLLKAEGDRLPFKSGTFDCVSLFSVLHHVYDIDSLLGEIFRVMKNGGILYTDNDPNSYFILRKFKWIKDLLKPPDKNEKLAEYHHHFTNGLDPFSVKEKLTAKGFSNIEMNFRSPEYIGKFSIISKFYLSSLNYLGNFQPMRFRHYFWIIASKKETSKT